MFSRATVLSYVVLVCFAAFALAGCEEDKTSEPTVGDKDALAEHACTHRDKAGEAIVASATAEDAPTVEAGGEPYTVTLDGSGSSYVLLNIPEPHFDWALFVAPRGRVAGATQEGSPLSLPELNNAACSDKDIGDYRFHSHEGEPVVVNLSGTGEVWMVLLKGGSDHAHDGGHSDHDGGHHHDAGDYHDGGHDAGHHHDGGHDAGDHHHD
ncbi:MAG: hypothetical protein KC416_08325 [Myxococcales bacterium]|nr:hypothetical protein [Myxococcales bacterium]